MDDDRWRWLKSTRDLQVVSFGVDPCKLNGDKLGEYVTWNATALVVEVGEFLREVHWKPWGLKRGMGDREAAVNELIDVGHFLGNMAVAMRCGDDEWETKYRTKQRINADRQASGTYKG